MRTIVIFFLFCIIGWLVYSLYFQPSAQQEDPTAFIRKFFDKIDIEKITDGVATPFERMTKYLDSDVKKAVDLGSSEGTVSKKHSADKPKKDAYKATPQEPQLRSDVVLYLTNGDTMRGTIVAMSDTAYILKWSSGKVPIAKKDVVRAIVADTLDTLPAVTLTLHNGGAIEGAYIGEHNDTYYIDWQGSVATFKKNEVKTLAFVDSIESKDGIMLPQREQEVVWPYTHDIVVKLTNGEILDSRIAAVTADTVTLRTEFAEGGFMDQDIERAKIETLLFKEIENDDSKKLKKTLTHLFPAMQFYTEGNITFVTDSYITWVRQYRSALRNEQSDIYLDFFPLFKDGTQRMQHFVVVFDKPFDYIEYAITDGVPGWIAAGYFNPDTKALYLYNMLGEEMEGIIRSIMDDGVGAALDGIVDVATSAVGKRYEAFVKGQAKGIEDKYWRYFEWMMGQMRRVTFSTLQHEFAHEVFSNWGLVGVAMSRFEGIPKDELATKKKFLESEDPEEKSRMIHALMTQRADEVMPEIKAANSWFSEGLATYCETTPIGGPNAGRIYEYQEMMRQGGFFPLEQLTVYKIGSFPGVYLDSMINAYAESWALVNFFMHTYPEAFMQYIARMSTETPEDHQDFEWLIEAVGKDARTIETELKTYMEQFPHEDDPVMTILDRQMELRRDLETYGAVNA